ncbi:MAG TPA: hypothetical protein VM677_02610 [Actinokineospora sp.]|nr:hypothetical protein [Actinokineospora sp.]
MPHYLPVEPTADVPHLHAKLDPWDSMTPDDLIDHERFYRYQ